MASLLIAAGYAIATKVQDKKQAKLDKRSHDEKRYRDLKKATNKRLQRSASGNRVIEGKESSSSESEGEEADEVGLSEGEKEKRRKWRKKIREDRQRVEGYENRDAGMGRGRGREKEKGGKDKGSMEGARGEEKVVEKEEVAPPPGYGDAGVAAPATPAEGDVKGEQAWGSRNPFRKSSYLKEGGQGGVGGNSMQQAPEIKST